MPKNNSGNVLPLFDPETMKRVAERNVTARVDRAMAQADAAIAKVRDGSEQRERDLLLRTLRAICEDTETFTVDAVWFRLERDGLEKPREPRLLGWTVRQALKHKWMERTGEYRPSKRRHGAPLAVYRSRLLG